MFNLTNAHQVFLYPGITDFRLGIYGLCKLIGNEVGPGSIYVFTKKTLSSIKVIEINENAFWLYHKKLHRGKFSCPRCGNAFPLSSDELSFIIEIVSLINKIETNGQTKERKFY